MHYIKCKSVWCLCLRSKMNHCLHSPPAGLHVCCHWSRAICLGNYIPHTFHAVIFMSCPSLGSYGNTGKLKWRQDKSLALRDAPARQGGLKCIILNIGTIVIVCSQDNFLSFCSSHHFNRALHYGEDPSSICDTTHRSWQQLADYGKLMCILYIAIHYQHCLHNFVVNNNHKLASRLGFKCKLLRILHMQGQILVTAVMCGSYSL